MSESVLTLDKRVAADVHVEKATLPPIRTIALWKALDAQKLRWTRVLADIGTGVIDDQEVVWTSAFAQEYERIKRGFFARLSGAEIKGAVTGPEKAEYKAVGARKDVTLFWTPDAKDEVKPHIEERLALEQAKVLSLGTSVAIAEGPLPIRRTLNLHQQYGPAQERFVSDTETRAAFHGGMDYILGQVIDWSQPNEHASAPLLRNLKLFRKNHARWATLQGRGIISLEDGRRDDAWMAVVPESSEVLQEQLKQEQPVMVSREGGIKLMRVLPLGFTREWAGLVGVHELEHLENAHTGKEPERPSKEEYIEGEIRAFTVEIGGADILSRGRFIKAIDGMIDVFKWRSHEEIRSMHNTPLLRMLANNLDAYITLDPPKSQTEVGLRLGLYSVATGFRLAEREAAGDLAKEHQLKQAIIEALYQKQLKGA